VFPGSVVASDVSLPAADVVFLNFICGLAEPASPEPDGQQQSVQWPAIQLNSTWPSPHG